MECSPSHVIITGGYSSGLGLALRVLGLEGQKVWTEDPGFPFTRRGLELARLSVAPIPVDASGIDVDYGLCHVPDAKLVIVTPGQQAPLGLPWPSRYARDAMTTSRSSSATRTAIMSR
jgi:GntR family transcriptional regulator / MocR family aminotransferase